MGLHGKMQMALDSRHVCALGGRFAAHLLRERWSRRYLAATLQNPTTEAAFSIAYGSGLSLMVAVLVGNAEWCRN